MARLIQFAALVLVTLVATGVGRYVLDTRYLARVAREQGWLDLRIRRRWGWLRLMLSGGLHAPYRVTFVDAEGEAHELECRVGYFLGAAWNDEASPRSPAPAVTPRD